jgi:hypothetical protein
VILKGEDCTHLDFARFGKSGRRLFSLSLFVLLSQDVIIIVIIVVSTLGFAVGLLRWR